MPLSTAKQATARWDSSGRIAGHDAVPLPVLGPTGAGDGSPQLLQPLQAHAGVHGMPSAQNVEQEVIGSHSV